jgi:hypothetical protein
MPIISHQNIPNAQAVPSAETVAATSPVANVSPVSTQKVIIRCTVTLTAGTATTAIVARIRQGSTTAGAVVGAAATVTLAAGNSGNIAISAEDTNAWLAAPANGGQYSLTLTQTAGTGNGTILTGDMQVDSAP